MRFKKLRISVGIALVLFILVTGSIISVGMLGREDDDNQVGTDLKVLAPVYYPGTQTNTQPTSPATNTATQNPTTSTTVVHKRIVTSAS